MPTKRLLPFTLINIELATVMRKKDFVKSEKYHDERSMRKICIRMGIDPNKYYPKRERNTDNNKPRLPNGK